MMSMLEQMLEWVENEPMVRMLGSGDPFVPHLGEVVASPDLQRSLMDWNKRFPHAFALLLCALPDHSEVATLVARTLVQDLGYWESMDPLDDALDDLFANTSSALPEPEKSWVLERPGVAQRLGLTEGKDYVRTLLRRDERDRMVPPGQVLPPIDTVAGVQARLIRQGYNAGPVTGQWNDQTARALHRFQVDQYHESPGELDDRTRSWLDEGLA